MLRKSLSTTTKVLQTLTQITIPGVTTYFCYENIQTLRTLDNPLKNTLKDSESIISSTVNALMLAAGGLELIKELIETGAWNKLSRPQQIAIAISTTIYLVGAGYSMSGFGVEHTTLWRGISATGGLMAAKISTSLISYFGSQHHSYENEEQPLDNVNELFNPRHNTP